MVIPIVMLAVFALLALVFVFFFLRLYRLWMRAFLSRASVSLSRILIMKLRRSDVNLIVDCRIRAAQADVPLSLDQLERASIEGADIDKLTLAWIEADRRGMDVSFEDLVDHDRSQRLEELFNS